jgi:uncharacterized repeat protein (TIGR01451 family)
MGSRASSKRVLAVLIVLCGLVVGVAGAGADAADPVLSSTTGSVVTNSDGSRTVTVRGGWAWTTHKSNCSQDKRAVGFAVDWNDPAQPGNVVTTLNGQTIDVGVATASNYNGADNLVHHTPSGTDSTDANVWRGGCGTFGAAGYNTGTWGPISHTYAPSFTGPITICALMYDVHLTANGGAPNNVKEITAGGKQHNGDNSAEDNKNTPLGNGCFATTIGGGPPPGVPAAPALALVKLERIGSSGDFVKGPLTAQVGQTVQYQLVVTNTGNIAETVHLTDARCDAGTLAVSNAPSETIAPGQSIAYTCTHRVVAGDGASFTNIAIASATAANGAAVPPTTSQVTANVQAAQTPAQAPKGVLGAGKTVKSVTAKAKPAHPKVRAARFTG